MRKLRNHVKQRMQKGRCLSFLSREMTPAVWSRRAVFSVLAILFFFAAGTFLLDPYVHYRKKSLLPTAFTQPYWQIPGVLKHYSYDTVIIGSSTAQNFNLALFRKELGLNPVKATASACYTRSGCAFAETAIRFNPRLKTIIYGLDLFVFFQRADYEKQPLPDFLYSGKFDREWCYWWNFDMLNACFKDLRKVCRAKGGRWQYTDPDLMFAGKYASDLHRHGSASVAAAYRKNNFRPALLAKTQPQEISRRNLRENLEKNLLPLVAGHPDVHFIFYFAPSSALNFADARRDGLLELFLEIRRTAAARLLAFPNVTFYDFQTAPETLEIDHYKDLTHYTPMISDRIVTYLAQQRYRVKTPAELNDKDRLLRERAAELQPQLLKMMTAGRR